MEFEHQLALLSKDYFEGKSPNQMKYLVPMLNSAACQPEQLLTSMYRVTIGFLDDNDIQMPVQYRTTFIKYVIGQIEKLSSTSTDEDDKLEIWYEQLAQLSTLPQEPFYRLYKFGYSHPLTVKIFENENTFVAEGTTGLMTWTASRQFVNWLLSAQREEFSRAKLVLELGSGTGLLGIAVTKACPNASQLLITDGSSHALENCRQNFLTNCSTLELTKVSFETLDWNLDSEKFKSLVTQYSSVGSGLLIGADIVFDGSLIPPLLNLINLFLDSYSPEVKSCCLLSCTVRNEATIKTLLLALEMSNRIFTQIHTWKNTEQNESDTSGMILKIT